ncbi:MAG: hypothetical protein RMJ66_01090 [Bacteroidia bacterium]|nr:hypothetical protein [Bacteroidia bacterium]MDW8133638.1 hypothetical protein [Bacteroidia bacterium]
MSTHPVHYYSQGGGISGSVSFQLSPVHTLLLEGFFLQNTYQRNGMEEAYYINPQIDSINAV